MKKPWSGRFKGGTAQSVEAFTESVSFDARLAPYDIQGSIAHARMLGRQGIIKKSEASAIIKGLKEIASEVASGKFKFTEALEDVHMNIESALTRKVGPVGGKLHTARSRNDQVALDLRLYLRDEVEQTIALVRTLQKSLFKQAEIAASMTLEALKANMRPYTSLLHEARGFKGAVRSAEAIRKCVEGGDLIEGKIKCKVQDAYSMRSTPQVVGAAHDAIAYAKSQVEIELNGVGDNPVFFPDKNLQISGANFQGTPVSLPMDMISAAITMVSVMSERRMNRLNNPALSVGLPAFLTKGAGMFSGLMLSQYTADMQIVEQRILSAPASVQSIPAAADQEDFVSMGMNTAIKNVQIMDNAFGILGIELMAAAQALDFRDYKVRCPTC